MLHVGFACSWWSPRAETWSLIAPRLRSALGELDGVDVSDLEAQRSIPVRAALAGVSRLGGRAWQLTKTNEILADRRVARAAHRSHVDAILGIAETDPTPGPPGFVYRDMDCLLALEQKRGPYGEHVNVVGGSGDDELRRMGERQIERARRATKVFSMSTWYADWLVAHAGIGADRIAVVGAGLNNVPMVRGDGPSADRVLFVGVDFVRKGGDAVLAACERLRASGSREVTLTIAGPSSWPRAGEPPPWVTFLGQASGDVVSRLYAEHDLFALPSRFEPYGIALLEARAAGLPCVARRAMAMPEIVPDGSAGRLVDDDDVDALAAAIDACLSDDALAARARASAAAFRAEHTWATIAARMKDEIAASLR